MFIAFKKSASASSIKTRIKTFLIIDLYCKITSASASSIKTRIKTQLIFFTGSKRFYASASSIKTRIKTKDSLLIVGKNKCECIFH